MISSANNAVIKNNWPYLSIFVSLAGDEQAYCLVITLMR